jgi:hypothetical protein
VSLKFDFHRIGVMEFGVGLDVGDGQSFRLVVVDAGVQLALREMAATTWQTMHDMSDGPSPYEPSEKYASEEYLILPLDSALAKPMRELHQAENLLVDPSSLLNTANLFSYFVRMTDAQGRRLTALRRATQFKGILKSRLIRFVTDSLKLVEDKVFKLDVDFDLLVDSTSVHILRPSGFEFAGKLQEAILAAVPESVKAIQSDLKFVDLGGIQDYASKRPRAARYLASIRAQKETKNIDKTALKKLCKDTGVEIQEVKGMIIVKEEHIMGFLEVLDRRRYQLQLVKESPERFVAASRKKL